MIISDLEHLESVSEETDVVGAAGVLVGAFSEAYGKFTRANTRTWTFAKTLRNGGSIAFGWGVTSGFAYTPPPQP